MAWNPGSLRKSIHDVWLAGICGGLGEHTQVPAWMWRAIFIVTGLAMWGVVAYIVLWVLMPAGGGVPGDGLVPGDGVQASGDDPGPAPPP
jgi:phage shock protein PspC (stress-responsive transcriptional regulator)